MKFYKHFAVFVKKTGTELEELRGRHLKITISFKTNSDFYLFDHYSNFSTVNGKKAWEKFELTLKEKYPDYNKKDFLLYEIESFTYTDEKDESNRPNDPLLIKFDNIVFNPDGKAEYLIIGNEKYYINK